MRVMLSAGEASGDIYGALVLSELRSRVEVEAFGLGGEAMARAGCELTVNARQVAAVGITEILSHLPSIYAGYRKLVGALRSRKPDVLVLIDFPDINFKLAKHAHSLGIPVIFFISPQIWAWKGWRIRHVQRYVSKMLVIFPFEEEFYRTRGVPVEFVGHPLAELPAPQVSRSQFAQQHSLNPLKQWITIMPGSRRGEVALNLPTILQSLHLLEQQDYQYILPVASTLDRSPIERFAAASSIPIHLVGHEQARAALLHSRAGVVASGTATIEAALIGTPFIVVYRVSGLTYAIGKRLVKLKHYAMPNLIAGREVVPELIQQRFTPVSVISHLRPLLTESSERESMIRDLASVRLALRHPVEGRSAIQRTVDAILSEHG